MIQSLLVVDFSSEKTSPWLFIGGWGEGVASEVSISWVFFKAKDLFPGLCRGSIRTASEDGVFSWGAWVCKVNGMRDRKVIEGKAKAPKKSTL